MFDLARLLFYGRVLLGESGLGKSTLVNSLFLTDLYKDRRLLNAEGDRSTASILLLPVLDLFTFGVLTTFTLNVLDQC